jgi:tRNA(Ile)-lysidine synthase
MDFHGQRPPSTSRHGGVAVIESFDSSDLPAVARNELARRGVARDATVVVACSGGVDSVALAHAVCTGGSMTVVLAHIEHGIRAAEERAAECAAVDRLGSTLAIPVTRRFIPAGALQERATEEHRSLEEMARRVRYDCLEEIAREHRDAAGKAILLTAHHRQDQVETILMRLFTGRSVLEALSMPAERSSGFPESEIRILRPFLGVRRETLCKYVTEHQLPAYEDATNSSTRYMRNRVRHELLPALDRVFPGWNPLDRIMDRASETERLTAAVRAMIPEQAWGVLKDDRWLIPRSPFLALPWAAREIVLRQAVYRIAPSTRVSFQPFRDALTGTGVVRAEGIIVREENSELVVLRDVVHSAGSGYLWAVDEAARLLIRWTEGHVEFTEPSIREYPGWLIGPVHQPVVVRPRRPGDTVAIADGRRSVTAILGRSGMARTIRTCVPVLEDTDGIVALFGKEGPICTRHGVQCTFERKTRREGFIFLCVENEETDIYAEREQTGPR